MQKRRFNFAFNLENEKHAKAYEILSNYPNRRRGEFVIQAILSYGDCDNLKKLIYEAVKNAVCELDVEHPMASKSQSESKEEDVSNSTEEIPDEAFSFLISL